MALCLGSFSLLSANAQPTGAPTPLEQGTYTRGMPRHVTPKAGPGVAHGVNAYLTADFIWWKAAQNGLRYASSGVLSTNSTSLSGRGTQHSPDFSWDPGFKVGLGVNLPYDGWDLYLQYTWLHSSDNKDRVRSASGDIQTSIFLGSFASSQVRDITEASSRWDLHFNVLDLELGRSYYISRYLTLRPFMGMKWTWQDQDWKADYTAETVTYPNVLGQGTVKMRQDHDEWGMGIRGGLQTSWYVGEHFCLFANGALSGLWTDYDVKRTDTFQVTGENPLDIVRNKEDASYVHAVLELQLGIRSDWWFSDEDYHMAISAAYEQQVWINNGNYLYTVEGQTQDLSLHGLTVKFRFDF